jgi:uncharacterized Zn-finger protein
MEIKNNGGFATKQIKCPHCGRTFRVEPLFDCDKDVENCPYCGEYINELSDDELIKQIEEAEKRD